MQRRDFLKATIGAAGLALLPQVAWSRPCPPTALRVRGGTAVATPCAIGTSTIPGLSHDPYFHDALPPNYIVDPARTTDGTGSEASPFQPSQVLGPNPASEVATPSGRHVIIEFLRGVCRLSGSDGKYPFLRPRYSGADGAWVVFRARHRANRTSTLESDKTIFERVGGVGSYMGVGDGSTPYRRIIFDGMKFRGWHREAQGVENFTVSFWNARFCGVTRCELDGQGLGEIRHPDRSTNTGGIWFQEHQDCFVLDNYVHDLGSPLPNPPDPDNPVLAVWAGLEHYDGARLVVAHNNFERIVGHGIFQKGQHYPEWPDSTPNMANRYVRNRIKSVERAGLYIISQHTGSPLGTASWFVQNLVMDTESPFAHQWVGGTPSGVVVANNTFVRGKVGFSVKGDAGQYADLYTFRNNIVAFMRKNALGVTGWSTDDQDEFLPISFVRNLYYSNAAHAGNTDEPDPGIDERYDFLEWQRQTYGGVPADIDGRQTDPLFVDTATDNFRLDANSLARNLGRDYLQLLGGAQSAPIHAGAYITDGMTDTIGWRRNV